MDDDGVVEPAIGPMLVFEVGANPARGDPARVDRVAQVPEQPTLTDGVVTLRRWRLEDIEEAVAGHDEVIAHWFGWPVDGVTPERQRRAIERWHASYDDDRSVVAFVVEAEGKLVGSVDMRRRADGVGSCMDAVPGHRGRGYATRAVRMLADYALAEEGQGGLGYWRVEAKVEPDNQASLRVATRSGLRREGLRRVERGRGDRDETASYVVLARLVSDPPLSEPEGFRALLNSFLPRKRAIGQLLVRDRRGPGAAVPADLQARLGPARRRGRGRRVAAAGGRPRDRGGARPHHQGRRPAAHRLAAPVGRLGRRGLPGLRRRRARPGDPRRHRDADPRDPRRGVLHARSRCASAAPTSPPAGSRPRWPVGRRVRRTPSPAADPPEPGAAPAQNGTTRARSAT